jgi:hypothetical protein
MPDQPAAWPSFLTPPHQLFTWLQQEAMRRQREDGDVVKHLATLRWLVLAELERPRIDFLTK